jgi:hypothetical protein
MRDGGIPRSPEMRLGSLVVFVEGLDEGNFQVQVRSKLMERTPMMVS